MEIVDTHCSQTSRQSTRGRCHGSSRGDQVKVTCYWLIHLESRQLVFLLLPDTSLVLQSPEPLNGEWETTTKRSEREKNFTVIIAFLVITQKQHLLALNKPESYIYYFNSFLLDPSCNLNIIGSMAQVSSIFSPSIHNCDININIFHIN